MLKIGNVNKLLKDLKTKLKKLKCVGSIKKYNVNGEVDIEELLQFISGEVLDPKQENGVLTKRNFNQMCKGNTFGEGLNFENVVVTMEDLVKFSKKNPEVTIHPSFSVGKMRVYMHSYWQGQTVTWEHNLNDLILDYTYYKNAWPIKFLKELHRRKRDAWAIVDTDVKNLKVVVIKNLNLLLNISQENRSLESVIVDIKSGNKSLVEFCFDSHISSSILTWPNASSPYEFSNLKILYAPDTQISFQPTGWIAPNLEIFCRRFEIKFTSRTQPPPPKPIESEEVPCAPEMVEDRPKKMVFFGLYAPIKCTQDLGNAYDPEEKEAFHTVFLQTENTLRSQHVENPFKLPLYLNYQKNQAAQVDPDHKETDESADRKRKRDFEASSVKAKKAKTQPDHKELDESTDPKRKRDIEAKKAKTQQNQALEGSDTTDGYLVTEDVRALLKFLQICLPKNLPLIASNDKTFYHLPEDLQIMICNLAIQLREDQSNILPNLTSYNTDFLSIFRCLYRVQFVKLDWDHPLNRSNALLYLSEIHKFLEHVCARYEEIKMSPGQAFFELRDASPNLFDNDIKKICPLMYRKTSFYQRFEQKLKSSKNIDWLSTYKDDLHKDIESIKGFNDAKEILNAKTLLKEQFCSQTGQRWSNLFIELPFQLKAVFWDAVRDDIVYHLDYMQFRLSTN